MEEATRIKKKEEKEEIIEDELDLDEDVLDDEEVEGDWRDKLMEILKTLNP